MWPATFSCRNHLLSWVYVADFELTAKPHTQAIQALRKLTAKLPATWPPTSFAKPAERHDVTAFFRVDGQTAHMQAIHSKVAGHVAAKLPGMDCAKLHWPIGILTYRKTVNEAIWVVRVNMVSV